MNTIKDGDKQSCISFNQRNRVLMLDARKIYRKVTTKVNDFSPEQLQNLICIVNLYRGTDSTGSPQASQKFESTVKTYLQTAADFAKETAEATTELQKQLQKVFELLSTFRLKQDAQDLKIDKIMPEWNALQNEANSIFELQKQIIETVRKNQGNQLITEITVQTKGLRKPQDKLIKQLLDAISNAHKEYQLSKNKDWKELNLKEQLDQLKTLQQQLSGNPDEEEPGLLHETEYFYKQAQWLTSRFPDGVYTDVEGLCKVVTQKEIEAKDWSLSPGRYVGVDTATDDDFDYEERLNEIHIELEGLNEEAFHLAKQIQNTIKEII